MLVFNSAATNQTFAKLQMDSHVTFRSQAHCSFSHTHIEITTIQK